MRRAPGTQTLGFASLAADAGAALAQWGSADKAAAEHKRKRKKDQLGGMTEEEAIAARARARRASARLVRAQGAGEAMSFARVTPAARLASPRISHAQEQQRLFAEAAAHATMESGGTL